MPINDEASEHLAALTQITRLSVAHAACGSRTSEALARLPRLRELAICGPPEWGARATAHAAVAAAAAAAGGDGPRGAAFGSGSSHRGVQGVPAVLALIPCIKLKRVVAPDRMLQDTRMSVESYNGHVPTWMLGPPRSDAYLWTQ